MIPDKKAKDIAISTLISSHDMLVVLKSKTSNSDTLLFKHGCKLGSPSITRLIALNTIKETTANVPIF